MAQKFFPVGHVVFRITDNPTSGTTFALFTEGECEGKGGKALFSGHVDRDTATQLRALADGIDKAVGLE
jgi:hypothetical protein